MSGPEEVVAYARSNGIPAKLFSDLGSVRTVVEASDRMERTEGEIGVTVLVTVQGRPMLVIVPGDRRVDGGAIAKGLDVRSGDVSLATHEEAMNITGYDTGTIPPFGHDQRTDLLVDRQVLDHDRLLLPAGAPDALIEVDTQALASLDHVQVGEWSVPKETDG